MPAEHQFVASNGDKSRRDIGVIDIEKIVQTLPLGKDHDSRQRRHELFKLCDPDGNGILSLAEVDAGLEKILGNILPKPVVNRAFHAARDVAPPLHEWCHDYVDANEFRLFLAYVLHYSELWSKFVQIDTNGDRRLSLAEIEDAWPKVQAWGYHYFGVATPRTPGSMFGEMDANQGGFVLFDEFAHWVLIHGIDANVGDNEKNEALKILKGKRPNLASADDAAHETRRHIYTQAITAHHKALSESRSSKNIDINKMALMLPLGKDHDSKQRRHELFKLCDPDANGVLSLAEVDAGLVKLLGPVPKPVVNRAFHAARDVAPPVHAWCNDYIDANEFWCFLAYVLHYSEMWLKFVQIDMDDDRRLSFSELEDAWPKIETWGYHICGVAAPRTPGNMFKEMDANQGGYVLFDEFSHWVLSNCIDVSVDETGKNEAINILKNKKPNLASADDAAYEARKHIHLEALTAHRNALHGSVSPNEMTVKTTVKSSGCVSVSKEPKPCASAHTNLLSSAQHSSEDDDSVHWSRLANLLPTSNSKCAKQKRHALISRWNINGNGSLSLHEADDGLEQLLGPWIPKPVVRSAFHVAHAGALPRQPNSEEYINANQFQTFLVYLKYYLELWRWFSHADTMQDHCLSPEEFEQALPMLQRWGCRAAIDPSSIDAKLVFDELDQSHRGFLPFDDFAHWALALGVDGYGNIENAEMQDALKLLRRKESTKAPRLRAPLSPSSGTQISSTTCSQSASRRDSPRVAENLSRLGSQLGSRRNSCLPSPLGSHTSSGAGTRANSREPPESMPSSLPRTVQLSASKQCKCKCQHCPYCKRHREEQILREAVERSLISSESQTQIPLIDLPPAPPAASRHADAKSPQRSSSVPVRRRPRPRPSSAGSAGVPSGTSPDLQVENSHHERLLGCARAGSIARRAVYAARQISAADSATNSHERAYDYDVDVGRLAHHTACTRARASA